MPVTKRKSNPNLHDPYLAFAFEVVIEKQVAAGFSEVSGLVLETEVETFREGGVNGFERQLPGPAKFPSRLVLKRGLGDTHLWTWYVDVTKGKIERKLVTIFLNDAEGIRSMSWKFRDACPVKWTGPELRAGTSAVAFESIELVHRGLLP